MLNTSTEIQNFRFKKGIVDFDDKFSDKYSSISNLDSP